VGGRGESGGGGGGGGGGLLALPLVRIRPKYSETVAFSWQKDKSVTKQTVNMQQTNKQTKNKSNLVPAVESVCTTSQLSCIIWVTSAMPILLFVGVKGLNLFHVYI